MTRPSGPQVLAGEPAEQQHCRSMPHSVTDAGATRGNRGTRCGHRALAWSHVGFRNRSGVPGEARLGRGLHAQRTRATGLRAAGPVREEEPSSARGAAAAAAAGQGTGAVGRAPEPGAGRPGLRPGQAGPAERDRRPVTLGPFGFRIAGPRLRQRRDPRAVRHRGAEEALPASAAQR